MFLNVSNTVKVYGSGDAQVRALDGVNFSLERGCDYLHQRHDKISSTTENAHKIPVDQLEL